MTTFTADDVLRLARLARVRLEPAEIPTFTRQLNEILAFAEQIQAVDTAGVEPLSIAPEAAARDDVPAASLSRDEALGAAADVDHAAGLFTVPRVIGG